MLDNLILAINRRIPEAPYDLRYSFLSTAPWLALLSALLGLLLGGRGLLLLQLLPLLVQGYVPSLFLLLALASPLLALGSIPGLRSRSRLGWSLFALSVLIDFLISLVGLDVFSLLFSGVFLYLLLQTYPEFGRRYY